MARAERAARPRGFTLIEVMCAVLILAMFVAAISQLLTQAQRNEGDARLRAEAGAYADRLVADVEEAIARGAPPPLGKREAHEGRLSATTEVAALDPAALAPRDPQAKPGARPSSAGPELPEDEAGWLTAPGARQSPPLLDITVRVSWEGAPVDPISQQPYGARRRTFALNPAALKTLEKSAGDEGDGAGAPAEGADAGDGDGDAG